jgi:hypothetical protein
MRLDTMIERTFRPISHPASLLGHPEPNAASGGTAIAEQPMAPATNVKLASAEQELDIEFVMPAMMLFGSRER